MNYQVWTKDEFGELWARVDCGDLTAAKREIEKAVRAGGEPVLTQELSYSVSIKLEEVKVETAKDKARSDKGPGVESEGKVRPGDTSPVPELGKGSRDPGTGDLLPGK